MSWKIFFISFVFLFSTSLAQAATLYVATTGSDASTNPCTAESAPCLTIQTAIDKASSGDTIRVAAGTYNPTDGSNVVISVINKNLTIEGAGANLTIIDGGSRAHLVIVGGRLAELVTVSKMTLSHSGPSDCSIHNNHTTLNLQYVLITNNTSDIHSILCNGMYGGSPNPSNLNIDHSTITSNFVADRGYLISNNVNSSLNLVNSTLTRNNIARSIIANAGATSLINSTIYDNSTREPFGTGGVWLLGHVAEASVFIKSSIIAGNYAGTGSSRESSDCRNSSLTTPIVSWGYNIIGNGEYCNITFAPSDRIGTAASLMDPQMGVFGENGGGIPTYALLPSSPSVDAIPPEQCTGLGFAGFGSTPQRITTDERGVSRPQGLGCDIGAYEFNPTPAAIPVPGPGDVDVGITPTSTTHTGPSNVGVTGTNNTPAPNVGNANSSGGGSTCALNSSAQNFSWSLWFVFGIGGMGMWRMKRRDPI